MRQPAFALLDLFLELLIPLLLSLSHCLEHSPLRLVGTHDWVWHEASCLFFSPLSCLQAITVVFVQVHAYRGLGPQFSHLQNAALKRPVSSQAVRNVCPAGCGQVVGALRPQAPLDPSPAPQPCHSHPQSSHCISIKALYQLTLGVRLAVHSFILVQLWSTNNIWVPTSGFTVS